MHGFLKLRDEFSVRIKHLTVSSRKRGHVACAIFFHGRLFDLYARDSR